MKDAKKNPVLVVSNLLKVYPPKRSFWLFRKTTPPFTAVNRISFTLNEGEVLGLLGANGAGKTTTINMLLGILKPTSGQINYFGKDFATHRSDLIRSIAHASAYTKLSAYLTIEESLQIMGLLYGLGSRQRRERIDYLMKLFGIEHLKIKQARSLSAGQMTRVMLVKAFLSRPRIVLLDEPTASLDPDIAAEVRGFILKMQKEEGVAVILTSHNMQEVATMCSRALVMKEGIIIEEDSPKMLAKKGAMSELFLSKLSAIETVVQYCMKKKHRYTLENGTMKIELSEKEIAPCLMTLAKADVLYESIEVKQPTLDDYFVRMVKRKK